MLLFVAKWSTMGQWIAALENEHFRLRTCAPAHATSGRRRTVATTSRPVVHYHGMKGKHGAAAQGAGHASVALRAATAFCEEAFLRVWTNKTSARLFSAFDAARQNCWTTELVAVTACIDKINRNRSNARRGTRAEIQHEDIDIMMMVFRSAGNSSSWLS